jgi:hypothetical protein
MTGCCVWRMPEGVGKGGRSRGGGGAQLSGKKKWVWEKNGNGFEICTHVLRVCELRARLYSLSHQIGINQKSKFPQALHLY